MKFENTLGIVAMLLCGAGLMVAVFGALYLLDCVAGLGPELAGVIVLSSTFLAAIGAALYEDWRRGA